MITLKTGKAICPVYDVKNSNRALNESRNWAVFFFKEKITLKQLKIVSSSDQRVCL